MKKTLLAMLLALSALFALSACAAGGSGSDLKASMTMDELADDIMGKVEFAMTNRVDLDDPDELEYFKERTGLDTEWLADHSFNTNMMVTADNLLLAEGKTAEDAAKIAEANGWIKQICMDTGVYYADLASLLNGSDGYISDEFVTPDGKTISYAGIGKIVEYFRYHCV